MNEFTIASMAAILLIFGAFRASFWIFSVDVTLLRSAFHGERLFTALHALQGHQHLGEEDTLLSVLAPLERSNALSMPLRVKIESQFNYLRIDRPLLEQFNEQVRRESAHAIAAWSTIAPGANTSEATSARRAIEDEELTRLAEVSSIAGAEQVLRARSSGDGSRTGAHPTAESLYDDFLSDIAKSPRWLTDAFRRGREHLLKGLTNALDLIGRGVTLGLLAAFAVGFVNDQDVDVMLKNVATYSLIAAALIALLSTLYYAVRLYRAATQEQMKGPRRAAIAYAVGVLAFTLELVYAFLTPP